MDATKECTSCKENKELVSFHKDKKGKLGVCSRCKLCVQSKMRTYYEENQQALTEKSQTFRNINSEVLKQRRKTYDQKYREKHPDKIRMAKRVAQASRRAAKLQATVSWADKELIKDMYLEAEYFQMEVDHIVPLQGKNVSGLHWEGNLQLLSAKDNRIKSNKHYA